MAYAVLLLLLSSSAVLAARLWLLVGVAGMLEHVTVNGRLSQTADGHTLILHCKQRRGLAKQFALCMGLILARACGSCTPAVLQPARQCSPDVLCILGAPQQPTAGEKRKARFQGHHTGLAADARPQIAKL